MIYFFLLIISFFVYNFIMNLVCPNCKNCYIVPDELYNSHDNFQCYKCSYSNVKMQFKSEKIVENPNEITSDVNTSNKPLDLDQIHLENSTSSYNNHNEILIRITIMITVLVVLFSATYLMIRK